MKKYIWLVVLAAWISMPALTIYDIQYTEDAGDGTYPSLYLDQMVTVTGIVTCNNYSGDKFFISMPEGGAWKGILVYHEADGLQLGDEIQITAEVTEYYGLTELQYVVNVTVLSTGNPVPEPAVITTNELNTMEAYEGVLVEITDAEVISEPDQYDIYRIDDGSGECQVGVYCISLEDYYFELQPGLIFSSITGCSVYSWGSFELTPRFTEDIILDDSQLRISLNDIQITENLPFSVPVQVFAPSEVVELNSFSFNLLYDSSIMQFDSVNLQNSLLQDTEISWNTNTDEISINFNDSFEIENSGVLFYLCFSPLNAGTSQLVFNDFILNNEAFDNYMNGSIGFYPVPGVDADELSVIQRPILALPEITFPGDTFEIICEAPENTENWSVMLNYETVEIFLEIDDIEFHSESGLYSLFVTCPYPQIYTLYDITVDADEITADTAKNAVSIIPEYKENYYFIHITDSHLPGHEFFGNDPEGEDFTEMQDLQYVIETINLLNPEFVLFTGDIVNEGELQDFNGRYEYSLAKNLISQFEVPVFITAGNHDIGGWNDTDPPPGSARHNWHRFFGWEYLEDGINGLYTQDYYFEYDNTLYIGLEAYDNYDSYLYNIFGDSSFTSGQITWLQDIIAASDAETKVAFYHFDFDDEINLSSLGLDMALWGHIHSNSGDINQYPYNLATKAVCDENRAFRTVFVEDNQLIPQNTSYAQNYPDINFTFPNNGNYNSNSVIINNDYNMDFDNAKLVFKLSPANDYSVDYGDIEYIIDQGTYKEAVVSFNLPASGTAEINISPANSSTENIIPADISLRTYPNPANPDITIEYILSQASEVKVDIYNLKGQHIETIFSNSQVAGKHNLNYTPKNIASGIYFLNVTTEYSSRQSRFLFMK